MAYRKVRVTMPKAQSGLEVKMRAGLGFNANQLSWPVMAGEFSEPDLEEHKTLKPVDRDEANLEAEVGETAVTNLNADGIPEQYMIGGKRHYAGGTPLNLPENSYIFSRDRSMKIKDKEILEQFGITSSPLGGVTPADIAKRYDLNKYKKILLDKNSDALAKKTAEMMIANYNIKLGKLALIQESMKGFPEGIPYIAMAYLETVNIDPEEILPTQQQVEREVQSEPIQPDADMARYGREIPAFSGGGTYYDTNGDKYTYKKDGSGQWYVEKTPVGQTPQKVTDPNFTIPGTKETLQQYAVSQKGTVVGTNPAANRSGNNNTTKDYMGGLGQYVKPPLSSQTKSNTYHPSMTEDSNLRYQELITGLKDPELRKTVAENFKLETERLKAEGKISTAIYRKVQTLYDDPDKLMDYFEKYQRQNYAMDDLRERVLAETNGKVDIFSKDFKWDPTNASGNNQMTKQVLNKLGFTDDEILFNPEDVGVAQAMTFAMDKTGQSDAYKQKFEELGLTWDLRGGLHEDKGNVYDPVRGKKAWSPVDGVPGDNTNRVTMGKTKPKKPGIIPTKPGTCKCADGREVPLIDGKCPCETEIIKKEMEQKRTAELNKDWWLQDVIRFSGAVGDFYRVKKYSPWQAVPAVDYIEPNVYSPERELAANAEQLAIGAEGAAQFADAQAYNARFSQMAGKAAANSADILGRYNNLNISVTNKALEDNVGIYNEYAEDRADDATSLYDKVTVANQQYDNAKNQARENMRQSYIDAITNASTTEVLNQLYPNYAIDKASGGYPTFTPGWGKPPATKPAGNPYKEEFDNLIGIGFSAEDAREIIGRKAVGADKLELERQKEEEKKVISYKDINANTNAKKRTTQ